MNIGLKRVLYKILYAINELQVAKNTLMSRHNNTVDFVVGEGEQAVTSNGSTPYDFGDGYWRWREWNSGKVEIWYYGTVTLTNSSTTSGVYRYMRRIDFPNSYSLDKCVGIINGTLGGGWLDCGGVFNTSNVHQPPFTKIEVMAYRIGSSPSQTQDNVHIYICGEKV